MVRKKNIKVDINDKPDTPENAPEGQQPDSGRETKKGDPVKELEEKLEAAKKEAKENYDRLLRVSAEFDNFKKRSAREMDDFRKYANEAIIKEILPMVDNLDRALCSCENGGQGIEGITEGVSITFKETLKILERFGVKPIEAVGKPFDPNYHQAVMRSECENEPENTAIKELQKGYMLHDRLIRPAMVIVSCPKGNTEPEKNE